MLNVDMNKRPSVNDILRMPIISQRIHSFLTQSMKIKEFSHTILHNKNFINNNFNLMGVPNTPINNLPANVDDKYG
jgi:NIMA (never in mitosis gene a)-related kinase